MTPLKGDNMKVNNVKEYSKFRTLASNMDIILKVRGEKFPDLLF